MVARSRRIQTCFRLQGRVLRWERRRGTVAGAALLSIDNGFIESTLILMASRSIYYVKMDMDVIRIIEADSSIQTVNN